MKAMCSVLRKRGMTSDIMMSGRGLNCISRTTRQPGPSCGGTTMIVQPHLTFKLHRTYNTAAIQAISCSVMGTSIVGCYLSAKTSIQQFTVFLDLVNHCLQGWGVLIGDLNSRDTSWDVTCNLRGPALRRRAVAHGFTTQRPPAPTLLNGIGSSRDDMCFHRNQIAPLSQVHQLTALSDHAQVSATLRRRCVYNDQRIPLSVLQIHTLRDKINAIYDSTVPEATKLIRLAPTRSQIEHSTRQFIYAIIEPWVTFCPAKPGKFKPGWTKQLDRLAKLRSKLLRSNDAHQHAEARKLDKIINRRFKLIIQNLRREIGDAFSGSETNNQTKHLGKALKLSTKTKPLTCRSVNHDEFTGLMLELQPPERTPRVEKERFNVEEQH